MKKSNGKFGVEGAPRDDNLFVWVRSIVDNPTHVLFTKQ